MAGKLLQMTNSYLKARTEKGDGQRATQLAPLLHRHEQKGGKQADEVLKSRLTFPYFRWRVWRGEEGGVAFFESAQSLTSVLQERKAD